MRFQEELASFKIPHVGQLKAFYKQDEVWGIIVVNGQGLKDKLVPIPEAFSDLLKRLFMC